MSVIYLAGGCFWGVQKYFDTSGCAYGLISILAGFICFGNVSDVVSKRK